jgi:DNA primase
MHRYPEGVPHWPSTSTRARASTCSAAPRWRQRCARCSTAWATPVRWEELETTDPAALVFELADVLARVERHGDLFADLL